MEYQYILNPEGNIDGCRLIIIRTSTTLINLLLCPTLEVDGVIVDNTDHLALIDIFDNNAEKLGKYVNALALNPNMPFELTNILNIINA